VPQRQPALAAFTGFDCGGVAQSPQTDRRAWVQDTRLALGGGRRDPYLGSVTLRRHIGVRRHVGVGYHAYRR
jgi:hypothetical protein